MYSGIHKNFRRIGVTARCCLLAAGVLVFGLIEPGPVGAQERPWLLIDTGDRRLLVMQGTVARQTFANISIGRSGVTQAKQRGDGKTPLGEFRIVKMTTDTPFHRFFTLDYPNLHHAQQGRRTGIISDADLSSIRRALGAGKLPPQGTALGGYIGIHGIGQGDAAVHEDFNWTYGCIALTNVQIDALSRHVYRGMKVIIRH